MNETFASGMISPKDRYPLRVNSRPMCTSDSRLDVYHQKEYGGGQDSGFIGASEVVLIETNSFLQQ